MFLRGCFPHKTARGGEMIRTAWARAGLLLQPQALGMNGSRLLSSSSMNCAVTIHKQKLEDVKITSEPNEFNSLSKEDMANIRQDLVRYGHEPWYDKKRGIYVNRAPRHEQDFLNIEMDRTFPALYVPKEGDENTRLLSHERNPEQFVKFKAVMRMGRHTHVVKQGRESSYSALVMMGNYNGVGGLGYGKADDPDKAVNEALGDCQRNLISLHLFENRTICGQEAYGHFRGAKVYMRQLREGMGISSNCILLREVFAMFGIQDLSCSIHGSHNWLNILKAVWRGLMRQRHPQRIARATGKKYYDRNMIFRDKNYSHCY